MTTIRLIDRCAVCGGISHGQPEAASGPANCPGVIEHGEGDVVEIGDNYLKILRFKGEHR